MPLIHPDRGITRTFRPVAAVWVQAPEFGKSREKAAGDFLALIDRNMLKHIAPDLGCDRLRRRTGETVEIIT